MVDNNSPQSQVQLAAALTSAGRASEALTILKALQKKPVRRLVLKAALYLELGRAHLNNREAKDAAREFFLGYIYSQIGGLSSLRLHLRAMSLLTRTYFELEDYEMVHKIAGAAMCEVHLMNHREAVGIMRIVADTYKAQRQTSNYHCTLEALSTIIAEGPVIRWQRQPWKQSWVLLNKNWALETASFASGQQSRRSGNTSMQ